MHGWFKERIIILVIVQGKGKYITLFPLMYTLGPEKKNFLVIIV